MGRLVRATGSKLLIYLNRFGARAVGTWLQRANLWRR